MTEGYKRQSYRANLDYDLSDKLTFKTSNAFFMVNLLRWAHPTHKFIFVNIFLKSSR